METILSEQDIINTYVARQQEQCRLYSEYLRIKKYNPSFGYKRISKLLGQPSAKTRWWNCGKHVPVPVQTVNWLKDRSLLPLSIDNPKINLIAKAFGVPFGDGGIFGNLNGIFLSSSELEAVKEFGGDLKQLFGEEIENNSRIIEGGVYGHSWCYQNTNRNIIRFFMALGAPIGNKSLIDLKVPDWINFSEEIRDEFFGSLFGAELGVPKVHISKNHLDTLSFGITGKDELAKNRVYFLNCIKEYLNAKQIETGSISITDHKKQNRKGEPTKIYRLLVSVKFENVTNFITLTKMNYCKYKKEKLANTMNEFSEIKRNKFQNLLDQGYNEERIMGLLQLTPASLEIIENFEDFREVI
ncbi:MAG: hypothetical protein AABW87_04170 [Nanoarchaeota archaeon]